MKKEIHFIPSSEVCSKEIHIELDENRITNVRFVGGCHGNTQGVAALLQGMEREEAIRRLQGICCKQKSTSCPDQLAKALSMEAEEV